MNEQLHYNIKAHDKISQKYEKEHIEIYNDTEQARLKACIEESFEEIETGSKEITALDFGCGAGNLTQHLLRVGMHVTAADVSKKFLELVRYKYAKQFFDKLSFLPLNGKDLSNVKNDTFDFIATYSVLHHIPDYLSLVKELTRVLKPGGILFIDHESSPNIWEQSDDYKKYKALLDLEILKKTKFERVRHLFLLSYWIDAFKALINPKFRSEGDIHVFQDDHIEWDKLTETLDKNSMKILLERDYLLFIKHCPKTLYDEYKQRCDDTRLLVAKKEKHSEIHSK